MTRLRLLLSTTPVKTGALVLVILGAWAVACSDRSATPMRQPATLPGRLSTSLVQLPRAMPSAFNSFLRSRQMPSGKPATINGTQGLFQVIEAGDAAKLDVETLAYSILTLAKIDRAGESRRLVDSAAKRIREAQFNEVRGYAPSHRYYGGTGADSHTAPDLAHTALAVRALRAAGDSEQAPSIRRAVEFISRCQHATMNGENVSSSAEGGFSNEPVNSNSDGGIAVACAPDGAATCTGLNGLIASGGSSEDSRVQAALRWLARHYRLDANPGMSIRNRGLYRYYYEFARAMHSLGVREIRDDRGLGHDWRVELADRIIPCQRENGSWENAEESETESERHPVVVTSYAVFALSEIMASAGVDDETSCAIRNVIGAGNH